MIGKPVPLRMDDATIERLDRVAAQMAARAAGVQPNRAAVIRAAIDRGLDLLEKELGLSKKRKTKK